MSLLIAETKFSLILSFLNILIKSCKVIFKSSFCLFSLPYLESKAYNILVANFESDERPNPTKGLIISSASNTPEPSSSQEINRF